MPSCWFVRSTTRSLSSLEKDDGEEDSTNPGQDADEVKAMSLLLASSTAIFARVLINRENPKNGIRYVGAPGDGLSSVKSLAKRLSLPQFIVLELAFGSGVANERKLSRCFGFSRSLILRTSSGYQTLQRRGFDFDGGQRCGDFPLFPRGSGKWRCLQTCDDEFARALLSSAKGEYSLSLKKKMVDDAYFMLHLVYPYHCYENPYRYKGSPRFCTQYNNPLTEENVGPILSGTATWLTLSLWEAAGLKKTLEGLVFEPILEKGQGDYSYTYRFEKSTYQVHLSKKKNHYAFEVASLSVDGVSYDPKSPIPFREDGKIHQVSLVLA
jgi:cellobiose phosphorylase